MRTIKIARGTSTDGLKLIPAIWQKSYHRNNNGNSTIVCSSEGARLQRLSINSRKGENTILNRVTEQSVLIELFRYKEVYDICISKIVTILSKKCLNTEGLEFEFFLAELQSVIETNTLDQDFGVYSQAVNIAVDASYEFNTYY
jgi:hypothetical protein